MKIFQRGSRSPREAGVAPFRAGLITFSILVIAVWLAFTKSLPWESGFELQAVFESANGIKNRSPVRIAGVNVGEVTGTEHVEGKRGPVRVTMRIQEKGLPVHADATLKIRPRIFLEGNYFVDLRPGSPSTRKLDSGETVPMSQTAHPVQLGQVLTALQSDTRSNLQVVLQELSKGLAGSGARGFNRAIKYWEPAFKYGAQVSEAQLGTHPGDFRGFMRGQARTFAALAASEDRLKSLITNLNITLGAFAAEQENLSALIRELPRLLRTAQPALRALNASFPPTRAFAREMIPPTRETPETIDDVLPLIRQMRLLFGPRELRGLSADLQPVTADLTQMNVDSVDLLGQVRPFAACVHKVLVPFGDMKLEDPDHPATGEVYKESVYSLTGLAGEGRSFDGNGQTTRTSLTAGDHTVGFRANDETFFGNAILPPLGTRPRWPGVRPPFKPGEPCEKQELPDLRAVTGPPEATIRKGPGTRDATVATLMRGLRKEAKDGDAFAKWLLRRVRK